MPRSESSGGTTAVARSAQDEMGKSVIDTDGARLHAFVTAQGAAGAVNKMSSGDVVGGLLDLAEVGVNTYRMLQACFAAGTHLLTREGSKPIEAFRVGDLVLSAPEEEAEGPVLPQGGGGGVRPHREGVGAACGRQGDPHHGRASLLGQGRGLEGGAETPGG